MSLTFFGAPSGDFLVISAQSGTPAPFLALFSAAAQLRPTASSSDITAPPPVLLPAAAQLWPTTPPVSPAASTQAYHAVTISPLSQKNHQKWCLDSELMDLCNLNHSSIAHTSMLVPQLLSLLHAPQRSSPNDK